MLTDREVLLSECDTDHCRTRVQEVHDRSDAAREEIAQRRAAGEFGDGTQDHYMMSGY